MDLVKGSCYGQLLGRMLIYCNVGANLIEEGSRVCELNGFCFVLFVLGCFVCNV